MITYKQKSEGEKFFTKIGAVRLSQETQQSFSDSAYTVVVFDEVVYDGNGVVVDIATDSIKVSEAGVYTVQFGIDAAFAGTEELALVAFVNGPQYSSLPAAIQGRSNNKPVSLYWNSIVELQKGDVVDLRAKNADTGSVTVNIRRIHFALKKLV
jgi:hypothetical protein